MKKLNRTAKKQEDLDIDYENWFRSHTKLMKELRYSESLKETQAILNAFKSEMKRSRNRYFRATTLHEYVKAALTW